MTINRTGTCDTCNGDRPADSWEEIGTQVHINGGKVGDTHHTFYQCKNCGSAWIRIEDQGGIGGNGTYYHSLTERFY